MRSHGRLFLLAFAMILLFTVVRADPVVGSTQQPAECTNLLQDPGFEAYTPSSYWDEFDLNYATPLCSAADCGTGGVGPRTGNIWAWFGTDLPDAYAYVGQTVTFPQGTAALSFYLATSAAAGSGVDDQFFVMIDSTQVFHTDATQATSYLNYTLVNVDVSAFADGGIHEVYFYIDTYDEPVSFHMDDVSLCGEAGTPVTGDKIFLPLTMSPPFVTQAPEFVPLAVPWADTTYTLTWNVVEGADTYVVEEDSDMFFPHPTAIFQGPQTSWTATWRPNATYWYRVRGQNSRGPGPWSSPIFVSYEGVFPSADAGIASGSGGTNFGTNTNLAVGYYPPGCPYGAPLATGANRSLLAFDTSIVPANLAFTKVELSIKLDRICFLSSLSGSTRTITAYRVTSPWSENGVTWANAPGTLESYGSVNITLTTSQDVFGRYSLDVTGLVRAWLNGSKPNYGLMLRSSESSGAPAGFTFDAHDGDGASPYLSISFSAADTASVQQQLELQPPDERQCRITAPGQMLCDIQKR